MNNRYLFRAKRDDTEEWVEGYLIADQKDEDVCFIGYVFGWNEDGTPHDYDVISVIPSTICQCTGLKDKNGVLIWENDIVRIVYNGIEYIYKVIWDASELDFKATNGKENYESNFQYLTCCEEIEIIGNSFDNKELLEVEE